MPHVKGIRRDGFINVDDNVDFRGTVRGAGDSKVRPYGSLDFYVDGTSGRDTNSGKSWNGAFATVQKAVTVQTANASGKGDRIWIAPGLYNEAVVATTLTGVEIIGATEGGESRSVVIYNNSSHAFVVGADVAYTTTMNNSAFRNITFYTPSAGTTTLAALRIDTIQNSIINNCKFFGNYQAGSGTVATVGLQLGCLTGTKYSFHEHSTISNCEFGTSGARAKEVDTGIRVGAADVTNPAGVGFSSMKIVNNIIMAEHYGINMWTGANSCGGTLIAGNVVHSHQGGAGANVGIISRGRDGDDVLCMVYDNHVNSKTHAIRYFATNNMQGNIVSLDSATPVQQYPASS